MNKEEKIIINLHTHCGHCLAAFIESRYRGCCPKCDIEVCQACNFTDKQHNYHKCCSSTWKQLMQIALDRGELYQKELRTGDYCSCKDRIVNLNKIKQQLKKENEQ